jgi:steroid delta-isomerase-like uncharacterized protein
MLDAASEANKRLVVRFYEELWNWGNYDVADQLVAADYVRHDLRPGDAPPGPAGQKVIAQRFRAAFPDVRLEIEALVAEGDVVVARWTMSGTHRGSWGDVGATGRSVRFSGVNFFRIAEERIAEIWNLRDDFGLREQVGAPIYAGYADRTEALKPPTATEQPHDVVPSRGLSLSMRASSPACLG